MGRRTTQWCDHCGAEGVGLTELRYGKPSDWPGIGNAMPRRYREAKLCECCYKQALAVLDVRLLSEHEWCEAMDQQRELNDTMHERARDETCKE